MAADAATAERRKALVLVSFMNTAGAQRAAHRVATGLAARGWDAELWFLYKVAEDDFSGVPVRVLLDTKHPSTWDYVKILGRTIAQMRRYRPDAVLSFLPLASAVGQFAAVLSGVRVRVASLRSPAPTFGRMMRRIDRLFGTTGVYTSIIAVSQAVADEAHSYPKRYRDRISVVHNGVEPAKTKLTKSEARAALSLPAEGPIAVSVGRLAPQKNYRFQLEIAERLSNVRLFCVGEGPDRAELEREIETRGLSDRVTLLGSVPASDVRAAYQAADMFIQPSLYEGQSNTLLEAMSAGLPVIVSDVPSQTETVLGGGGTDYGQALPLDAPDAWAEAMEKLAADEAFAAEFSLLSLERAGQFTVAGQIDGFEAALAPPDDRASEAGGRAALAARD
ncbi:MAG: glycosyltransferase [Pseudomonadota bacterium]